MEDRIIVKFSGGLGNQLFEYAFYEWIKKEFPDKNILADLSYYKIDKPHNSLCVWEVFSNLNINVAGFKDLFDATGEIPIFYGGPFKHKVNKLRERINSKYFKQRNTIYRNDNDWVSPDLARTVIKEGKSYLDSYWQDSEYVTELVDGLRELLQFRVTGIEEYENLLKQPEAVSVHIRRGDYVGSIFDKEVNMTYYKKAIEYVGKHIQNPHFYFFSDDQDYVREAYEWVSNKTMITGFEGKKSYTDMYLMSITPTSIMANSTFSLWAAYLNGNKAPLIIYPKVEYMKHKALDNWIGL